MTSNRRNTIVLAGALLVSGAASLAWLDARGFSDDNLRLLLRLSARVALLLFLLVFVARPLAQLYPSRPARWLLRNRRLVGIAFASVHTTHLALIFGRFETNPEFEISAVSLIVGGGAYLFMYLMLITSYDAPARALGPKSWRRLHKTGLYWIAVPFAATLLPASREQLVDPAYLWFVALLGAAVFIRLTAFFALRKRQRTAPS